MRELDDLFVALGRSTFRARFKLTPEDQAYVARKSRATIRTHSREFVEQRLAAAQPEHDGKQTPMKGHPVFVAQHATATCCRKCLTKWHEIDSNRTLSNREVAYIVGVIDHWIARQMDKRHPPADPQLQLFPPTE